MGDYYLDGPVFLKTGIHLNGRWSEDDSPFETRFRMHGSGTGADGVINADGVSDAFVSTYLPRRALTYGQVHPDKYEVHIIIIEKHYR